MAALAVQLKRVTGLAPTWVTPTATTGDTFANDGKTELLVKNESANPVTVSIAASDTAPAGYEDPAGGVVAAGTTAIFSKFPTVRFGTNILVICSATTDITIAAVKDGD